jgi:hypothetical protein
MLQVGEWPKFYAAASKGLPRTTKAKLASLLHAIHQWWEMPTKDPEVKLVAELGLQDRILQELSPGAHARVPSQKGAQCGCWHGHSPRHAD